MQDSPNLADIKAQAHVRARVVGMCGEFRIRELENLARAPDVRAIRLIQGRISMLDDMTKRLEASTPVKRKIP